MAIYWLESKKNYLICNKITNILHEERNMAVTSIAQACDLVIFGTKGDLARRKLLPSL